ncbi:MAG TPA: ChbG/HpnK family deacetylase [Deltaproteobacteria bacterium]|nr:ChbG/HpnK family deacetylase [Deltaproteobacteria bacterium]HOI05937.1 ChbG/HpnK family deacetylase [Deltaproteobacteria bacterium]
MTRLLVVNADDLGLSREVNAGILMGLGQGVISDASLLVDAPCAEDACLELLSSGIRSLGIHINLDSQFGWDLPGHERHAREDLMAMLEDRSFLDACEGSARSQIERFMEAGLNPTHLDTHHHVHGFYPVFRLLMDMAREYRIPAMRFSPEGYTLTTRKPVPFDREVYGRMKRLLEDEGIYSCRDMVEGAGLVSRIASYPAELVVHPSLGGDAWRQAELETLLSEGFRSEIEDSGIRIVSFSELACAGERAGRPAAGRGPSS